MVPAASLDWLYHLLGYTLAAAGVALLAWSLFWDRSRGRRRCPKCWYDMHGVPGLTCPECGKSANNERRLLKTRPKRFRAAVCVVIFAAAYIVHGIPDVMAKGWKTQVPSTLLIAALPWLDHPTPAELYGSTPVSLSIAKSLYQELLNERLMHDKLAPWQEHWLIGHMTRGDRRRPLYSEAWRNSFEWQLNWLSDEVPWQESHLQADDLQRVRAAVATAGIQTRKRWPEHTPVFVRTNVRGLFAERPRELMIVPKLEGSVVLRQDVVLPMGTCGNFGFDPEAVWEERLEYAGSTAGPQSGIECDFTLFDKSDHHKKAPVFQHHGVLPIEVVGGVDDVLRPQEASEIEAYIRDHIRPQVMWRSTSAKPAASLRVNLEAQWTSWHNRSQELAVLCGEDTTLGVRLDLLRDGRAVATGRAWWRALGTGLYPHEHVVDLTLTDPSPKTILAHGVWTLRITGDGEVALRNFEKDQYWKGEATVPVTWVEDFWKPDPTKRAPQTKKTEG